ncbi:MAG TPA: acetyl-CoA carboxylase, carboxyltransferase subunit beta [Polyangiaceae bacterium]|nr:acetyl-CoA carboxylase, carboxyltransferase subunit beta [Polyangiaceae bacterium]
MAFPSKTPAQIHESEKKSVGRGVFQKCGSCGTVLTADDLERNFNVCSACGFHHQLSPERWRDLMLDDGKLEMWDQHISPADPLQFFDGKSYQERIRAAQEKTSGNEGIEIGRGSMDGRTVAYGLFVFKFMGGSMGSVVGERITRLFERATAERIPVILMHASGGARMQEGILSLMQMAKSVSALRRFRAVRKPYISVCLHPTTGGVAASTAFLGDVNVVEPGALIGFAGPRVIEGTIRQKLPEGFQRSEFLLEHGMVDTIVPRGQMKARISNILRMLDGGARPSDRGTSTRHG